MREVVLIRPSKMVCARDMVQGVKFLDVKDLSRRHSVAGNIMMGANVKLLDARTLPEARDDVFNMVQHKKESVVESMDAAALLNEIKNAGNILKNPRRFNLIHLFKSSTQVLDSIL